MPRYDAEPGPRATGGEPGDEVRLARALFPELASDLDRSLEARTGTEVDGFDAWLDGETLRVRRAGLDEAAFSAVRDADARERFERAFSTVREISAALDLSLPEPEAFAAAGCDFAALGDALSADPTLAPVPAPHGIGLDRWKRLFARAAEQTDGPLSAVTGIPLVVASEAEREFALLEQLPTEAPAVAGTLGHWTLRLVPAGLAPAVLGLSFEHGPHATLPEMLMLQLMRAAAHEPLVDARSFTWVAGALADGRLAARHVYDTAERAVRVNCREIGNQGPHLGARPPIG